MTLLRTKREKEFQQRLDECQDVLTKHPGEIPIVLDKDPRCHLPNVERQKFLVPPGLSMGQFVYVVRKRINLSPQEPLYITVNRRIIGLSAKMGDLHAQFGEEDGFLYGVYAAERRIPLASYRRTGSVNGIKR
jgi:GABA(A) receptor-associated protein